MKSQYTTPQHPNAASTPTITDLVKATDLSDLLLEETPTTVGGNLNDQQLVRQCLDDAVLYFQNELTDSLRSHIKSKWGLNDTIINNHRIGFVPDSNDVIYHLDEKGYSYLTMLRAGLGTSPAFKHVFECNPSHEKSDCNHNVPKILDVLADARANGAIEPAQIDLEEVAAIGAAANKLRPWNWWSNRIVFPYKDARGKLAYLILRKTNDTDDLCYVNGIADHRGGETINPVTVTGRKNDEHSQFLMEPPAVHVEPDRRLHLKGMDDTINFRVSPPDCPYDSIEVSKHQPTEVQLPPGLYLYETGWTNTRGAVYISESTVDEDEDAISDWLEDIPTFERDIPKYIKQPQKAWVNERVINEPIFGLHTIQDESLLVITEGITDAMAAHQHNIPCITPATTEFKREKYDEVLSEIEVADTVVIINDSEANQAGLDGALKTGVLLEEADIDVNVLVGTLPRSGQQKVDLAEFFKTETRDDFIEVLNESLPPKLHPQFDPEKHAPTAPEPNMGGEPINKNFDADAHASGGSNLDTSDYNTSQIFELDIPAAASPSDIRGFNPNSSGADMGRQSTPFNTSWGNGKNFVFYSRYHAYDYHISAKAAYNSLIWMAVDAGLRPPSNPEGRFSDEELWEVWLHAKTTTYVDVPDDDPVPARAMWHLARKHDLAPAFSIPDSFQDDQLLPASVYNDVLGVIEGTYGVNPGRTPLDSDD